MPKTNAKVQTVNTSAHGVIDKEKEVADGRSSLVKMLKIGLAAKTHADFDKTSMPMFALVKKVEAEIKALPHLIAKLDTELTGLNKLVADKGKSLTYRAQLMASKSKATAFKQTVQWAKGVEDYHGQAERRAAVLLKENLGEMFYDLRKDLDGLKKLDAKKYPAEASKHIKNLIAAIEKNDNAAAHAAATATTIVADGKRLSSDPDLDDDE